MTPQSKGKEKILIDEEETEYKWEKDANIAIEEAINRATRTEEAKRRSLREIIASITIEQPVTITLTPTTTRITPTKSHVATPRPSNNRKRGTTFWRCLKSHKLLDLN